MRSGRTTAPNDKEKSLTAGWVGFARDICVRFARFAKLPLTETSSDVMLRLIPRGIMIGVARRRIGLELIVHCGLHKTATTTFQKICADNRKVLAESAVLYPHYDEMPQHSRLMHKIQAEGVEAFGDFLRACVEEHDAIIETVVLSGEDFENCLIDIETAIGIESEAYQIGFEKITWLFVNRPMDRYLDSLYSEMSKHGVVLDKSVMLRAANERGSFFVSTRDFNYMFALDFWRHEKKFSKRVSGTTISISMEEFTEGFSGKVFFQSILSPEQFATFENAAILSEEKLNERLSSESIEENYVATALRMNAARRTKLPNRLLLHFLGRLRLRGN